MAHIDIIRDVDDHIHLHTSSKVRGKRQMENVRQISCCLQKSELCLKAEVEADSSGNIKHYTGTGTTYTTVDVSTHQKRYDHCEANPDSIYCEIDPKGDAHTEPVDLSETPACAATRTCNCGAHYCDVGDCLWHWRQADAYMSTEEFKTNHCMAQGIRNIATNEVTDQFTISANDGTSQTCTATLQCATDRVHNNHVVWEVHDVSRNVWLWDNLVYCPAAEGSNSGGQVKLFRC